MKKLLGEITLREIKNYYLECESNTSEGKLLCDKCSMGKKNTKLCKNGFYPYAYRYFKNMNLDKEIE